MIILKGDYDEDNSPNSHILGNILPYIVFLCAVANWHLKAISINLDFKCIHKSNSNPDHFKRMAERNPNNLL